MIPQFDIIYSLRREAGERAAVALATDPAIREAHLGLADRYADRAWGHREQRCVREERC